MPSAALYAVAFTFARGFESYLRSHSSSGFQKDEITRKSVLDGDRQSRARPGFRKVARLILSKRYPPRYNFSKPQNKKSPVQVTRALHSKRELENEFRFQ